MEESKPSGKRRGRRWPIVGRRDRGRSSWRRARVSGFGTSSRASATPFATIRWTLRGRLLQRRDAYGERHERADVTCLKCHEAKLSDQVAEGCRGCAAISPLTRRGI